MTLGKRLVAGGQPSAFGAHREAHTPQAAPLEVGWQLTGKGKGQGGETHQADLLSLMTDVRQTGRESGQDSANSPTAGPGS
jgi:hypothetical protein